MFKGVLAFVLAVRSIVRPKPHETRMGNLKYVLWFSPYVVLAGAAVYIAGKIVLDIMA